jgi:GNAT superfamily N-acetyltransferase
MQIKEIRKHQLQEYIDSTAYKTDAHVAISKHRAMSHLRNPRLQKDDLVLVLVYQDDKMVAYLGVFSDDLYFDSGVEHVGWLSCMWVHPVMRGKGVAKQLLNTVFEAWGHKILVTEFTPAAAGLYQRTGQFVDLKYQKGYRGYLRPNLAYLLPQKNPKWLRWKSILSCIDFVLKVPNALRLKRHRYVLPTFEYIAEIDDESWTFAQQHAAPSLVKRTKEDLNWMLRNPWLISAPMHDHTALRYSFSARASNFQFLTLKIYDDTMQLQALLLLSIKGRQLKVPYCFCISGAEQTVLNLIYHHMIVMGLDMITLYQPSILAVFKSNKNPFYWLRPFKRRYIIGKVLEDKLQSNAAFEMQDGDADAAFT